MEPQSMQDSDSQKEITETVNSLKIQEMSRRKQETNSSATGNPRNKTALKPGHSLMDWIRLGQSGIDLTGVKGVLQDVTPSQLAKHNKRSDAWLAIRGRVYNVTRYMDFHPGGEEELMKGVGIDATQLFNQVHAWVNFESLLQKCLVGHLRKSESSRLPDLGALLFKSKKNSKEMLISKPSDISSNNISAENPAVKNINFRSVPLPFDWFQKADCVTLVYYTKLPCPQVDVQLQNSRDLSVHISICERTLLSHVNLEDEVLWPCKVLVNSDTGKVEVQLQKKCARLWHGLGSNCADNGSLSDASMSTYLSWQVVDVLPVTHNSRLIVLHYPHNIYKVVPVGHHVRVRSNIQGTDVVRCYTPVPPCLPGSVPPASWSSDCLCLMVKQYEDGALTPWLCGLGPGDHVDVAGPEGSFTTRQLQNVTQLYLLAAGTGLTPMLNLLSWVLDGPVKKSKKVNLMFFNRSQQDILWQDQLDKLQQSDDRFTVVHRLSEPDDGWCGLQGHVDKDCIESLVPGVSSNKDVFICVCGPDAFTELTSRLLDELGCPRNQYHCFQG